MEILQPIDVFLQSFEIRIFPVGGIGDQNAVSLEKARQIIDMPVGIVAGETLFEPEHGIDRQTIAQCRFHALWRNGTVAVGVEQNRLGRHQLAGSVGFDGPTLQHEIEDEPAQAELLRDPGGNAVVPLILRKFTPPGIETPVGEAKLTPVLAEQKERPIITNPNIVGLIVVAFDPLHATSGGKQIT